MKSEVILDYVLITGDMLKNLLNRQTFHQLTENNQSLQWTTKCQEALRFTPILPYAGMCCEFIVETRVVQLHVKNYFLHDT